MVRPQGVAKLYVHTVVVETFTGTSGYGVDQFAAPVTLDPATGTGCFVDPSSELVRTSDTETVVSSTTVYTYPAAAPLFTVNSRVTIDGVVSRVIRANLNTSGTLGLPDHVAVKLT